MSFDTLTLAAVRDELNATVVGGKIERVFLPDQLAVAFELYHQHRTWWLYCSAHAQHARIHLVSARPPRPSDDVSPLLLLLRKYARGGRLESAEQEPRERVLRLQFRKWDPDRGEELGTTLVVEIMGRHSNLIFLDANDTILDSAKRIGPDLSRYRAVLPKQPYRLPPPQIKTRPETIGGAGLAAAASSLAPDLHLWQMLIGQVQACSPLLAREVSFRAEGDAARRVGQVRDWDAVAHAVQDLFAAADRGAWEPSLAYDPAGEVVAFAPYRLTQFPDVRPAPGIGPAVEAYFGRRAAAPGDEALKRPLRETLQAHRERLVRKLRSLREGLVAPEKVDRLRRAGEYILAYQHTLEPGQEELEVPEAGERVRLDPTRTPVENAQAYFRDYAKAKAAAREVPELIAQTEHEQAYLADALALLEVASSPADVKRLRQEWAEVLGPASTARTEPPGPEAGGSRPAGAPRRSPAARGSGRGTDAVGGGYARLVVDGFPVVVGRTGRGNEAALKQAAPGDLWLHARGTPGAHVIVRAQGRDVPERVLRAAAGLAAGHSQARSAASVAVDYTARRYVDRVPGAPPGLVTYRNERTIHVAPRAADELLREGIPPSPTI